MEIPRETTWKRAENRTLQWGQVPPRAEIPTFKWLYLKNLRSTTIQRECRFQPHFFALDDTRTAIQLLLHAVISSSAKHSHRLEHFSKSLGQIQNLDPTT
jgi:hypothetical protein